MRQFFLNAYLYQFIFFGHNVLLAHSNFKAFLKSTPLTKASGYHRNFTCSIEWARKILARQCIATKECLTTLTRDRIEIVAERFVTAYHTHFIHL